MDLKTYLAALAVGLLVGVIYSLFNVRSPAPPVIALVGLFGILLGEQIMPLFKRIVARQPINLAVVHEHARDHVFGPLPTRRPAPVRNVPASPDQQDSRA